MDLKEDIVKKTEFDPQFQPFAHEQLKFRELVSSILDQEAVSSRLTDSQKEFLDLRFVQDKSFGEIASEIDLVEEKVKDMRLRNIENLSYILELCDVKMDNVFEEKNILDKLEVGHQKISESFDRWQQKGIFTKDEVEIMKYYSKIFNGLGDKDSNTESLFYNGVSSKNKFREGDDFKKVNEVVRKLNRYFWAKHFS